MSALELQVTSGVLQASQAEWPLFSTEAGLLTLPLHAPVSSSPTLPKPAEMNVRET